MSIFRVSQSLALVLVAFVNLPCPVLGEEAVKIPSLSREKQIDNLNQRRPTGSMMGAFSSFASLLYATEGTIISSKNKEVRDVPLHTVHPACYKPTRFELLEAIARQTETSFKYGKSKSWEFEEPEFPLQYEVKMPAGWKMERRGNYSAYIPAIQPVGMDIYVYGRYSGLDAATGKKVKEEVSSWFGKMLDKSFEPAKMKTESVDGEKALYWECRNSPAKNVIWRQWTFIKNNQCFVIVSSLDVKNEEKLLPEVRSMVASFHALDNGPKIEDVVSK